jgi:Kef-type K+ transport system membrane component KefB
MEDLLFALGVILIAAKLGAEICARLGQPAVLGELVMGMIIGNLSLAGVRVFDPMKSDAMLETIAQLGVLILLFEVGLQSTVRQMLDVGASSLLVAIAGITASVGLGFVVSSSLLAGQTREAQIFVAVSLASTSVGISARVLQDLGKSRAQEARVILGAAVVDDVLGLLLLTVATRMIGSDRQSIDPIAMLIVAAKATVFLAGALALGVWSSPLLFRLAAKLRAQGVLLAAGLSFCFLLSWIASLVGLAPIIGALAAGLILEDGHQRAFVERGEQGLRHLVGPIGGFLVPIFFVLTGMRTNLGALLEPSTMLIAVALTCAAIMGKQACALGVMRRGVDRLSIGIGMIPRGEVTLVAANLGASLVVDRQPLIDAPLFSAIVLTVVATTILTPPALKWSLTRSSTPATP